MALATAASSSRVAPATFYTVVGDADVYWRARVPAQVTGSTLAEIPGKQTYVFSRSNNNPLFPWHIRGVRGGKVNIDRATFHTYWAQVLDRFVYPAHEGVAVWTRPCGIRAKHALAMREQGIVTVAELDDNLLSAKHLNMFMRFNEFGPQARIEHLQTMACFDRVVFSTEWLRDEYATAFRKELKGWPRPELFVCGNHANLPDWPTPTPPREDGRLRIGWMGSAQHARDIKLAYQALAWARQEGHDIVLVGNDVRDETGVTHPRALEACRAWRSVITTHIPWIKSADYHRTAKPFDIGIAPLELNKHTLGKSDVKATEYVLSGAVPLLQNHPVYSKSWRHRETAMLANSPREFEVALRELCQSERLRDEIKAAGAQYVRECRTMQVQGKAEWEAAIGV